MRVKVHYLISDTDDGTDIEFFANEAELEKARFTALREYWKKWGGGKEWPDNLDDAWEHLTSQVGFMDTLNWGEQEVEVPQAEPLVKLAEVIADCVKRGVIKADDLPDDFQAITHWLDQCGIVASVEDCPNCDNADNIFEFDGSPACLKCGWLSAIGGDDEPFDSVDVERNYEA